MRIVSITSSKYHTNYRITKDKCIRMRDYKCRWATQLWIFKRKGLGRVLSIIPQNTDWRSYRGAGNCGLVQLYTTCPRLSKSSSDSFL